MTDELFDDPDDEQSEPKELSESEERERRYEAEAATKLTNVGGLNEPLTKIDKHKILATVAGVVLLAVGGGVAWAKTRAAEPRSEREVIRRDSKPLPTPEWAKGASKAPVEPDEYDKVDPKDPAFTTPITAQPAKTQEEIEDTCPAEMTIDECVRREQARMTAEGDPKGKGPKYMGSTYAANPQTKAVKGADWEVEDLAPMGYFGGTKSTRQPSLTSVVPQPDVPMSLPSQGLQLPPNLKQALEHAAQGQSSDPDDVKEEFASRPGTLDSEDDERELAECELTAGTVIHVANLSAINTDVPAKSAVTACVTQTVYCGPDNQHVAVPPGSCFTASANARVSYGDERIQLCMEQLKRPPSRSKPNGSVTPVKCWAAADITGMIGWDGEVDNHWDKLIAGVALSTFLSLGTTSAAGSQEGFAPTIAQKAAGQAGQQLNQAGQRIVQRDLARKPTITRKMLQSGTVVVTENKPIQPWVARKARRRTW